jgi:NAD(P)-dependent dehydrogenase (short-subunit alcohol dehydrogenase family)
VTARHQQFTAEDEQRVALVTGASRGIGRTTALALAADGWQVIASMRQPDVSGPVLEKEARAAGVGDRVTLLELDVTDPASVAAAIEHVETAFGRLDLLVNNAGIAVAGPFEEIPDEDFRRVFDTNVFGVMAVTRQALPLLRRADAGRVVVVSSEGALFGAPGLSPYISAKWAIEGWAECLSHEVHQFGIDVVCAEPGPTKTDIWDGSTRYIPETGPYASLARAVEKLTDRHMDRVSAAPDVVGRAIADAATRRPARFRVPIGRMAVVLAFARGVVPHSVGRGLVQRILRRNGLGAPGR